MQNFLHTCVCTPLPILGVHPLGVWGPGLGQAVDCARRTTGGVGSLNNAWSHAGFFLLFSRMTFQPGCPLWSDICSKHLSGLRESEVDNRDKAQIQEPVGTGPPVAPWKVC